MIQQFRMSRPHPVRPKVARRRDNARPEHVLPKPVDRDARRQRIVGRRDPIRERDPPLLFCFVYLKFKTAEHGQRIRRDDFALRQRIATVKPMRWTRLGKPKNWLIQRSTFSW